MIRAAVSASPVPAALLWRRDWSWRWAGPAIDLREGVSLRCPLLLPASPGTPLTYTFTHYSHTFYLLDNL